MLFEINVRLHTIFCFNTIQLIWTIAKWIFFNWKFNSRYFSFNLKSKSVHIVITKQLSKDKISPVYWFDFILCIFVAQGLRWNYISLKNYVFYHQFLIESAKEATSWKISCNLLKDSSLLHNSSFVSRWLKVKTLDEMVVIMRHLW